MPESRSHRPSNWDDFPPDWMKPDAQQVLSLAASGHLYADINNPLEFGWTKTEDPIPAHPIGDDPSSTAWVLWERGYLMTGDRVTMATESGETFTAERMVLSPAGRELHQQLNSGGDHDA